MNYVRLLANGVAFIYVDFADLTGKDMHRFRFLVDTGATSTTIPKPYLVEKLGYSEDYITKNKVVLTDKQKPTMANGERADVYKVPITRMNIGGYEFQHDHILTSDTVNLSFLLGLDVLQYFKFTYDFDSVDPASPYGKMIYELRETKKKAYTKFGESFAHSLLNEKRENTPSTTFQKPSKK